MSKRALIALLLGVPAALALALWPMSGNNVAEAADHADPPDRSADTEADIGDFYAWHKADGNMVVAISFAGNATPVAGQAGAWDRDVLYGIHFSNTGSAGAPAFSSTNDIWIRFGQNVDGDWGVRVMNMPGETGPVVGSVEEIIDAEGGGKVFAGLSDDPFFFDLEGFMGFVSTGSLASFDSLPGLTSTRDSVAGQNATVLVLEFPADQVTSEAGMVHAWATTSRIGG